MHACMHTYTQHMFVYHFNHRSRVVRQYSPPSAAGSSPPSATALTASMSSFADMEELSRGMVRVLRRGRLHDACDGWARLSTLHRFLHDKERGMLATVAWSVRGDVANDFYFEKEWFDGELWICCVESRRRLRTLQAQMTGLIQARRDPAAASHDLQGMLSGAEDALVIHWHGFMTTAADVLNKQQDDMSPAWQGVCDRGCGRGRVSEMPQDLRVSQDLTPRGPLKSWASTNEKQALVKASQLLVTVSSPETAHGGEGVASRLRGANKPSLRWSRRNSITSESSMATSLRTFGHARQRHSRPSLRP